MKVFMEKQTHQRRWVTYLVVAVIALVALFVYHTTSKGKSAPDVTFVQLNGERIALDTLRGKVVMINFWATSCTTCIKEMPDMVATYNKYHEQGLDFIAVAMQYDPPNYVVNYAQTRQLPFRVALDSDASAAKAFGDVQLTPTTFVIDKQGKIIKQYVGEPDFGQLHQLLEKELAA
jgi:peroxiredoxin